MEPEPWGLAYSDITHKAKEPQKIYSKDYTIS
jgi:hypothetical protein